MAVSKAEAQDGTEARQLHANGRKFRQWASASETLDEIAAAADVAPEIKGETALVQAHIDQRYWLLRKSIEHWRTALNTPLDSGQRAAPEFFDELVFDLAVADLFVEKAQAKLTERADSNMRSGLWYIGAAIAALLCAAFALAFVNYNIESPKSWQSVVYKVLATAGMVGLVLGAVYVLVMVARASFHEGTILRNRRHSLRLGRLFLYLKLTSASNAHDLRELKKSQLNAIEMESIFGWNLESSSAFKDIKGEAVTGTLFGQVLQTVQKGLEAFKPVK